MHPYIENLKEFPARTRLNVVLGDLPAAEETAHMVGPEFLRVFPSRHRQKVSEVLGHPFIGTPAPMGARPPDIMKTLGPYTVLMGVQADSRADYVTSNAADFEDFFREIPEFILMVPEEDRERVAEALSISIPDEYKESDDSVEPEEDHVDNSAEPTSEEEHGRFGKLAARKSQKADSTGESRLKELFDEHIMPLHDTVMDQIIKNVSKQEKEVLNAWWGYLNNVAYLEITRLGYDDKPESAPQDYRIFPLYRSDYKIVPPYNEDSGAMSSLNVYGSDDKLEELPLDIIASVRVMYDTPKVDGEKPDQTDVHIDETVNLTKKTKKKTTEPVEKKVKPPKYTAAQIYDGLTTPIGGYGPIGEVKVKSVQAPLTVSSFPEGVKDDHGNALKFGQGPEGFVRVMVAGSLNVQDISLADIEDFSVGPRIVDTRLEDHPLAHKFPDHVEYLNKYVQSVTALRTQMQGKIIAVVDLETVGLLQKFQDRGADKDRSVPQLLEIAGMKITEASVDLSAASVPLRELESTGGFVDVGDPFDEHVRLVSHNNAVLTKESVNGFGNAVGGEPGSVKRKFESGATKDMPPMEAHKDLLHWALQYVHRSYLPRKTQFKSKWEGRPENEPPEKHMLEINILGVPKLQHYVTPRSQKDIEVPTRLSAPQLQAAMKIEAQLMKQHEALKAFLEWMRGSSILCGHYLFGFDKNYISTILQNQVQDSFFSHYGKDVAKELANDAQALKNMVILDTLHLVKIMFLPAINVLSRSVIKDLPAEIQAEAKRLLNNLKSADLTTLSAALGYKATKAHDAMADVKTNVYVLMHMMGKMLVWEEYFISSALYEEFRDAQYISVGKGFPSKVKKKK